MYKTYETQTLRYEGKRGGKNVITVDGLKELVFDCVSKFPLIQKEDVHFGGISGDYYFYIETEFNFSVGATLYHNANNSPKNYAGGRYGKELVLFDKENKEQKKVEFYEFESSFSLNFASTSRSLSTASVCVELYKQMIALGQLIESMLEQYDMGQITEIK